MEKKKYKVLKPIAFDGRKDVGEIVELTEEQAQTFGNDFLELVIEPVPSAEEEKVEADAKPENQEKKEESENEESDKSDS